MSSKTHRLPVFSSDGRYCVKHLPLKAILSQVELGAIVPFKPTPQSAGQWRVAPSSFDTKKPDTFRPSPATISFREVEANAGLYGPKAQAIAKAKVDAWGTTHDTKCVVICAGKVFRPD